jgi:hypothetical protein
VTKDDDFWMYFLAGAPLLVWLIVSPYVFLALPVALLISGSALGMTGAVLWLRRSTVRRRAADARRHAADVQLELARWAQMSHLSEADERWLAERHFWVVPVQVALLRAGLDPKPDSRESDVPAAGWCQRREVQARSQAARADFEGIRRTQEFIESEWNVAS